MTNSHRHKELKIFVEQSLTSIKKCEMATPKCMQSQSQAELMDIKVRNKEGENHTVPCIGQLIPGEVFKTRQSMPYSQHTGTKQMPTEFEN